MTDLPDGYIYWCWFHQDQVDEQDWKDTDRLHEAFNCEITIRSVNEGKGEK
jgi:hypothetical protein